jgi:hypothetical protein
MQELPINDFLHDDMLLKVIDSNPWYANIVNFMVATYIPLGENKKKLQAESRRHLWDDPYLYRVCSDELLRRCVPTAEGVQIIEKCHVAPYGGTMEYFTHKPKSGSAGSFGLRCTKTPKNSSKGVRNASCKEASLLVTQCPYTTTCK